MDLFGIKAMTDVFNYNDLQKLFPHSTKAQLFAYVAYSASMASTGQLAAQATQSTQTSASMTYWLCYSAPPARWPPLTS